MEQGPSSPETVDDSHPQISIIKAFVEITSCPSKSQALFFLESHNFELDAAVSTFFDSSDANVSDAVEPAAADDLQRLGSPAPEKSRSRSQSQYSPSDSPSPDSVSRSPSPRGGGARRRPYGLRSAGRRSVRGRVSDPNDEDDGSGSDPDFNPSDDDNDLGTRVRARDQRDDSRRSQPQARPTKRRRSSSSRSFTGTSRLLSDEPSQATLSPPLSEPPPPQPPQVVVDQSQPSTSIQIRLCDGTRLISQFNNSHTIRDVRAFVDSSSVEGPRDYRLQTMDFPPKQLSDLDRTIEESGIANSVLIQRL